VLVIFLRLVPIALQCAPFSTEVFDRYWCSYPAKGAKKRMNVIEFSEKARHRKLSFRESDL
jgi:hypothetical protein